jgi:hypothetical protein
MNISRTLLQSEVCRKYGSPIVESPMHYKVGAAKGLGDGPGIINGLRHPATEDTTGWYLWPGTELEERADFFDPLHAYHLLDIAPSIIRFLSLAPGWRFLIDDRNGYEDVWFDARLLEV